MRCKRVDAYNDIHRTICKEKNGKIKAEDVDYDAWKCIEWRALTNTTENNVEVDWIEHDATYEWYDCILFIHTLHHTIHRMHCIKCNANNAIYCMQQVNSYHSMSQSCDF